MSVSASPAYRRERKRKARDNDSTPVTAVKRRLFVPPILPPAVEPQPDLNSCSDGVSLDQLLDDLLMSGLTPDQVLGDFVMPVPESDDLNSSFSMANHADAGSEVSNYCDMVLRDEGGAGARMPFHLNFDQILLGDLLRHVAESEVSYSVSMSDHAGSMARNYHNIVHGGSVTPLFPFDNSDQFDLSMTVIEPLPTDLQSQTAILNFSFLPCAPYAGICDSWTGGDTTDDEAASVSWYGSAPSSLAVPTEWMMQSPFATPYQYQF
ncbi:hypothetical protein ZWY2020_015963 [Hordeum vulgare]|nr:hypothetical protein ZWY2020_015963 [Hordeum vulgare]